LGFDAETLAGNLNWGERHYRATGRSVSASLTPWRAACRFTAEGNLRTEIVLGSFRSIV